MSSAPQEPQDFILDYRNPKRPPLIIEQLDTPNVIRAPDTPLNSRALNHGLMAVSSALRQRVKLRCDVEVNANWRGSRVYKRMRACSILVSAPNPEQAELFIQALHDFAASLSGKWLAPPPTPGPNEPA